MCVLNNRIIVFYGVLIFLKSQTRFSACFFRAYFPQAIPIRMRFSIVFRAGCSPVILRFGQNPLTVSLDAQHALSIRLGF